MSTNDQVDETSKFNPLAGCSIFIVILLMISFLTIMFVWQGGEHEDAIHAITEEQKVLTAVAPTIHEESTKALESKITTFAEAVRAKKKTTLTLDCDELNLLIAHYDRLQALESKLYVTEIKEGLIHADIGFPVRADASFGAFIKSLFADNSEGAMRYLNGTMTMKPEIVQGSVFPRITTITPNNGHAVPEKYIREFPTFLFTEYRNDETLAYVLHEMDEVTLSNGSIHILSDPSLTPAEAHVTEKAYNDKLISAAALFGLFVFIFITSILFIRWAKKRKQ